MATLYGSDTGFDSIGSGSSITDCNNATNLHKAYVIRTSALNRPNVSNVEFHMSVIHTGWSFMQIAISSSCDYLCIRSKPSITASWLAWKKITLT
jgi:hypothetical protein